MEIRQMESKDVEHVTVLCEQFGYSARTKEVEERFQHLIRLPEHQIFVVEGTLDVDATARVGVSCIFAPFSTVRLLNE